MNFKTLNNSLMDVTDNKTMETPNELNTRYADTLLPLTVLYGIFAVVGIIGNTFVLTVFSFRKSYTLQQNNFRVFVICMSVIDLITSTFLIPAEMVKHRHYFAFESESICKAKCFINLWTGISGALSLLVICVDRYLKVVLIFKKQISPKLAVQLCVAFSFVVPSMLSVPSAVMCGIQNKNKTNVYNTTTEISECTTQQKYENSIFKSIYKSTFVILLVGISIICLTIYLLIGRKIYKHWVTIPASFIKDSYHSPQASTSTYMVEERNSDSTHDASSSKLNNQIDPPPKNGNVSCTKFTTIGGKLSKDDMKRQKTNNQFSKSRTLQSSTKRHELRRQSSGFGMRRFPYKTLIWFVLTVVFILTYMLCIGLSVYMPSFYENSPQKLALLSFFFRLYFINSIINPVIYALLDKRFRHSCKDIMAQCIGLTR